MHDDKITLSLNLNKLTPEKKQKGTNLELFQVWHDIDMNTNVITLDRGYDSKGDQSRVSVNKEPSNELKCSGAYLTCKKKSMISKIMIWNVSNIGKSYKRLKKLVKKNGLIFWLF